MGDLLTAIGLMSGVSLDGVDAAILKTDGERTIEPGPALHIPYERDLKVIIRRAVKAALEGRSAIRKRQGRRAPSAAAHFTVRCFDAAHS